MFICLLYRRSYVFRVGVKVSNLSIRLYNANGYYNEIVPVLPLDEVLEQHVGTKTIEFASIDLEGAEIPILDALKYDGRLTNAGVTFCQVHL